MPAVAVRFSAVLGSNAGPLFVEVPGHVLARLADRKRVPVRVRLRGVEYPSSSRRSSRALRGDVEARAVLDTLPYSHRKEYLDFVAEARREDTRRRRIERALAMLREGRREPAG